MALKYKTLPQQIKNISIPIDITQKYVIKSTSTDFRDLILHVDPQIDMVLKIYQRHLINVFAGIANIST